MSCRPSISHLVSGPAPNPHRDLYPGSAWDRHSAAVPSPFQKPLPFSPPSAPRRKLPGTGNIPAKCCLSCLPERQRKQFIISLHCKVIRNQRRFPSSLGFPLSDNSMGGFPLAPGRPTHYLTSPHCLSPLQRAQEASAMKCQRARRTRGLLCLGPAVSELSTPMDGGGKVFYQCHSATAGTPGPGRALVCLPPPIPP